MLRNTASRIKKACSGALVPRILKGNHCCEPVSYAVVRKAHTKSTDDGKQDTLASEGNIEKKSDEAANQEDKTINQSKSIVPSSIPLTHRERCQRIIDKAFGPCEHTEANTTLTPQYCSHTVNLEDTRREILESEKAKLKLQEQIQMKNTLTPYGFFKMSRELIKEDHDEITLKDSVLKEHPDKEETAKILNNPKATAEEPDLTKNLENIGTAEETAAIIEPYLTNAKEDFEKFANNPETIENKTLREDDAETIEMVKDERKTNLYLKAISPDQKQTLLPYTRTQIGVYTLNRQNENKDEIVLIDNSVKMFQDVEGHQLADRENLLANAKEEVKKCLNDLESVKRKSLRDNDSVSNEMVKDEKKHMFIHATTAKEDEEQLTQKLETIEETPLVEAQKPKLEGFNVSPRVLGDKSVLNYKIVEKNKDNSPRVNLPGNLDDVAKRYLNTPIAQIDEMLLNELEKRPSTSKIETKTPSKPLLGDILVQMDELKKLPNFITKEQELHCESSKFEETKKDDSDESYVTGFINPISPVTLESRLSDLNKQPEENYFKKSKDSQPAGEMVKAIKQEIENTSPLKNTPTKEAVVTEIHILGFDKIQESERTTNVTNAKAPLSEEIKGTCLSKEGQCDAETKDIYNKVTSFNSPNDASNNIIKNDKLLKSGHNSNFKGVCKPTYYGVVKASKYAMNESQSKPTYYEMENASKYAMNESQSKDDKKMFNSRSLSAAYMWGHKQQDASASKIISLQQDKNENHLSAHHGQSTEELMAENEESTVFKGFNRLPYYEIPLPPVQELNKSVELSPEVENITPLCCQDKPTEESQLTPCQEHEKVSISDELLKEHALDPYYVLACNETCPIAPTSTGSNFNDSDFVDTTQTIYMKKNILESKRPKLLPNDVVKCEKMLSETEALYDLDEEFEPELIPEIEYTIIPDDKSVDTNDVSLLKLNEQVSLSELLKRVRQRNRLEFISNHKTLAVSVDPTVGKCDRKAPRCQPTAPRAPTNQAPPLPFGLPMLKRRPPVCKTPKKKSGCKCTTCDMDMSCGIRMGEIGPGKAYELNEAETCALKSCADLTEVVDRLNSMGKIMSNVLHKMRSNTETFFARDYDPWTPIPSWPIPQKTEKKKWEPGKKCDYRCPVYPKARASMNPEPPCNLKPCRRFPTRRSFSMLDFFTVTL